MMKKFELETQRLFESKINSLEVERAKFVVLYTNSGSSSTSGYIVKNGVEISKPLPGEIKALVKEHYNLSIHNPSRRFNKVDLEITPNKTYSVHYTWEDDQFLKDQADTARVFPHWINERMISIIYAFEFPNGPTNLDDDGEPVYRKTWDRGVFTYKIENDRVACEIELFKGGVSRRPEIDLPSDFIDALLEHHKITNNGSLKEKWKPWNKLMIISPNNDLPFARVSEHVFYSLQMS